jgi:hypothetical protein
MTADLAGLARRLEELERSHAQALRELRRLQDIEAIKQVKYRYWRGIDSCDSAMLRGILTDDFSCRFGHGNRAATAASADEFVERMARYANSQTACQHHGHHPEITIEDDGLRASGTWYLQGMTHHIDRKVLTASTCFYNDKYLRTGDGWKLQSSWFESHISLEEKLDFMPHYTQRYLATHGRKL